MSRWWWWCWWCCCLHGNSQWFSVLSQVHGSTEQEIREMHDEQANPQNAVVSTAGEAKHCGKWSYNTVCWTGWGFIVILLYGVFTAIKQSWWLICNIDHYGLYARDVRWNSASELMFWVKTIGLNTSELIWTLIFFDLIWILRCFIFTLPFVLFYCSLFCCSPLCRTDGTQMCWKCSFLFLVLYLRVKVFLLSSVCERDNWFPWGRGGSNSLSTPWTLLLNLSLRLFRERWMWGWSIQFARQIIQRGERLFFVWFHTLFIQACWPVWLQHFSCWISLHEELAGLMRSDAVLNS